MNPSADNSNRRSLGGLQFWTDWGILAGWRLQRYYRNNHWRVLDPDNRRTASGGYGDCLKIFKQSVFQYQEKHNRAGAEQTRWNDLPIVFLVHGLARTRNCLKPLQRALRTTGRWEVVRFGYASTRASLKEHAAGLQHAIRQLPEERTVYWVGHSMGNLVIRRMLWDFQRTNESRRFDQSRMVMLGPPNQGSAFAKKLKYSVLFNLCAGQGGREFSWNWDLVKERLATPSFEFGIIRGAQAKFPLLSNPLLSGPDDWTVAARETELDGAADTLEGPYFHATMMKHPAVVAAVSQFLRVGQFSTQIPETP